MYGHEDLFQGDLIHQMNESVLHNDIGEVFSFNLNDPGSTPYSRNIQSPQPTQPSPLGHGNSFGSYDNRQTQINNFGMEEPAAPIQQQQPAKQQRAQRNIQQKFNGAQSQIQPQQPQQQARPRSRRSVSEPEAEQQQMSMHPQGYMQMPMQGPPMNQGPMGHPQMGMGHQQNPQMNSQMNPQMNQMNPQMSQMNPQMNQQMNPQMNSQMNQQMNQQMNPQMNQQMNPQMVPQQMGQMNQQMNPQQMSSQMGQQMNPQQMSAHQQQMNAQMGHQMTQSQMNVQRQRQIQMMQQDPSQMDQQYRAQMQMHLPVGAMDNGQANQRVRKKGSFLPQDPQQYMATQPQLVSNPNVPIRHHKLVIQQQNPNDPYPRPKNNQLRISQKSQFPQQYIPIQANQEMPLQIPLQLPLASAAQYTQRPRNPNMKFSQIVYQQPQRIVSHPPIMSQANYRQILPGRGVLRISQERLLPPEGVIYGPDGPMVEQDDVVTMDDFQTILSQLTKTVRVLRGQGPPGALEHLKNSLDQFRAFMIEIQASPHQLYRRQRQPQQHPQQPIQQQFRSEEPNKTQESQRSPEEQVESFSDEVSDELLDDESFEEDGAKNKRKFRKGRGGPKTRPKKRRSKSTDMTSAGQIQGPVLTDFEIKETLGSGTFGTVFLCKHRATNNIYCLKKLEQATVYQLKQMEHLKNEKNVLFSVSHPGIVKLYKTFHDQTAVYLLMEYVPGGELFLYIRKHGRLSEEVARFYVVQIILIFEYLHSRSIIYRDLKPENLLLDENGHIKLADFGFSKQIEDRTWTMCGTPDYLAPEVIKFKGHGFGVDWWALGILIYEMVAGFTPFRDETIMGLFAKILEPQLIDYPLNFSTQVVDLIGRFLVANPAHRLGSLAGGTMDIKNHEWFHTVDWEYAARREGKAPIVPQLQSREDTSNFKAEPISQPPQASASGATQIPPEVQAFFDAF